MKKNYQKPAMRVVKIQQTQMLCGSPDTTQRGYEVIGVGENNEEPI